jgi:hypothetical protein
MDTQNNWKRPEEIKSSLKNAIFNPTINKNPHIKGKALYKLCPYDVENDQWHGIIKLWKFKK